MRIICRYVCIILQKYSGSTSHSTSHLNSSLRRVILMHTVMSSHTDTAIIFSYAASVNYPALNFLVTTDDVLSRVTGSIYFSI